ncbi:hypothetical protein O181_035428 [Austropuccinia psidii MF-1]|uniref:Uncharacterized protein n=1 Tax=Austropuccinia psidii MF-1 TaxID=1389203 RepID=A0A9Q3H891_9BASI|nr:hypothetical protein [Austropuccinia psidii MF-1]
MSGSTRSKKALNNDAESKPLSNEEVYSLLNSLRLEVSSLKSARNCEAAEMHLLRLALSSPPSINSRIWSRLHMTDLCRSRIGLPTGPVICNRTAQIFPNGLPASTECFLLPSTCSSPLMTSHCYLKMALLNKTELYPISSMLRSLCIGIILAHTTAKEFLDAIKARCYPGNHFQKLQVVRDPLDLLVESGAIQHKPNSTIILELHKAFAIFKKLGVDADELEGLLTQAACHAPASLDRVAFNQLVTSAILAKGEEQPLSTFIGQVILNTSQRDNKHPQHASPFVYHISEPKEHLALSPCPGPPYFERPIALTSDVRCPPEHLADKFGVSCFHCGCTGHWQADHPHTKGVANPNLCLASPGPSWAHRPSTQDCWLQPLSSAQYQRERLSQVEFVEHDAVDHLLIDTGASIHLSGSTRFLASLSDVTPFRIFFADLNPSVTISQTTTLKIPVKHGFMIVQDVPFSKKILGTILSVGWVLYLFLMLYHYHFLSATYL